MKTAFIFQVGCGGRSLDAGRIQNYLLLNNYKIVKKPNHADIIIFVTCAVYNNVTEKVLKKIKKLQKYNAELIVAGCLPEIDRNKLSEIFDGKTLSTKDLDKIDNFFPENKIKFKDINDVNILFNNPNYSNQFLNQIFKINWIKNIYYKFNYQIFKKLIDDDPILYQILTKNILHDNLFYNIRISTGCQGNCTYCAVKKAIGSIKSKPISQCAKEFEIGLKQGYKNFIIEADDVGAYGVDIKSNFPELLDKLTGFESDYQIVIRHLSPQWAIKYVDDMENIIKSEKITMLDIPIQSGSPRILTLMKRFNDIDKIKNTILRYKISFPDIKISTDIIVGFPSETFDEFKKSLDLIKEIKFDKGVITPFSCKAGTIAEKIEPKITFNEISKRVKDANNFLKKEGYKTFKISSSIIFALK